MSSIYDSDPRNLIKDISQTTAVGAPFVQIKNTMNHSGKHSVFIGGQEDATGSIGGFGIKIEDYAGFKINY